MQNIYDVSLVVDCTSNERFNVLLQNVLLKFVSDHYFLYVVLHYVLLVICIPHRTLEDVAVEAVRVDNF